MMDEKILQDEIMSADELDAVAGGDCYETADDSRFLNSLNGSCDRYGATKIWCGGKNHARASASTRNESYRALYDGKRLEMVIILTGKKCIPSAKVVGIFLFVGEIFYL